MDAIKHHWKMLGAVWLLASMSLPVLADDSGRASLTVTALETEHTMNPLGIDAQRPCLRWQMAASSRGAQQTAYRIQVADTRQALSAGEDLIWDSGRVTSDRSLHHGYEGPALDARHRYFWRVRVWDEAGEPSAWSDPAWWEMGLGGPSDWQAQWIEPGWTVDPSTPQPSPMLRAAFEISGDVQSARLYVTSHGLYEAHLNGQRVGDQVFTPGWTSYDHRLQYQTYDVTDQLVQGENAIGAILGDGWYRGYIGFQGQRNFYGERLGLLAQLHVTYADGRTEIVTQTGDEWSASTGPIRMSDIYIGETYDARLEKDGWAEPGYDGTDWQSVRTVAHSKEVLIAPSAPPVEQIQRIKPIDVIYTPEGDTVLDMGQNMIGWMQMTVEGEAGAEVTLRHAEVLDKDGNFYTDNLRAADQTVTYILRGAGEETYAPHFTFQGFRYVDVSGYPGPVDPAGFTGVVIHSDMTPTGHFESSHPLVNQLQHNIVWGMKGNFLDIPTDCPQRDERLGWTGDIQVFAPTASFNMDAAGFLEKWLRDVAVDQRADGSVPHVVPNVLGEGASGAAGWADASVIVPWVVYQAYGNEQVLATQYESMKAWVDYMHQRAQRDSTAYLWDNDFTFGDWLAFTSDPDGARAYPGAYTNTDLIATAYFARSTDLLRRTAEILGKEEDAREYGALFEQIKQAFQKAYMTPRGRVLSDTQTSYLLALQFGLLPDRLEQDAAQYLVANIDDRGHLTTGFLGTPHLNPVLSAYGYDAQAYALLLRTEYPSWLYPVTMGATTIWERWDGIKPDSTFQDPGMNSFNHYAYGAIGEWLYKEVAGIQAVAPGYKDIVIAPTPGGGLTHARGFLDSGYGRIESDWTIEEGQFQLAVTIPANTQATVRLPDALLDAVTEGGQTLAEAEGISASQQEGDDVVLRVGAGAYVFAYDADRFEAARQGLFTIDSPVGRLLANEEARGVLNEYLPALLTSPQLEQARDMSLRQIAQYTQEQLTDDVLQAIEGDLRQIEDAPDRSFSAESPLGLLLADPEARRLLRTQLPQLMNSPWLSQAMGFPLARSVDVIPEGLSPATLQAADQALQQIGH